MTHTHKKTICRLPVHLYGFSDMFPFFFPEKNLSWQKPLKFLYLPKTFGHFNVQGRTTAQHFLPSRGVSASQTLMTNALIKRTVLRSKSYLEDVLGFYPGERYSNTTSCPTTVILPVLLCSDFSGIYTFFSKVLVTTRLYGHWQRNVKGPSSSPPRRSAVWLTASTSS